MWSNCAYVLKILLLKGKPLLTILVPIIIIRSLIPTVLLSPGVASCTLGHIPTILMDLNAATQIEYLHTRFTFAYSTE